MITGNRSLDWSGQNQLPGFCPTTLESKTCKFRELRTTYKWCTWAEGDVQANSKVLLLQPRCMNVPQHTTCQGSSFGASWLALSSVHNNAQMKTEHTVVIIWTCSIPNCSLAFTRNGYLTIKVSVNSSQFEHTTISNKKNKTKHP